MSARRAPQLTAQVESALGPAPESLSRPEVRVLRFRRHGRRLVFPVMLLAAIAAAAGYFVGALPEAWMNVLALTGAAVLAFLLGILPIFSWLATRTTITTRRVIANSGFFTRQRSEISLDRVREVRTRQGMWKRMWGAGDIDLLVGAEMVRLRDVAGVRAVSDALQELVQRNFANRGPQASTRAFDEHVDEFSRLSH